MEISESRLSRQPSYGKWLRKYSFVLFYYFSKEKFNYNRVEDYIKKN